MRLQVQASQKALCSERERKRERKREGDGKRERERRMFKQCRNLSAGTVTVLKGCSCLSGVATYLPGVRLLTGLDRNASERTGMDRNGPQ